MIILIGGIFGAISQSWHYIKSAVKSGIESSVAFTQTIAGGLKPDLEPYEVAYDFYEQSVADWQSIGQLNYDELIPSNMSMSTPFDWRDKHIMQMRIQGTNPQTGESVDRWITVENNRELTKGEWLTAGQQAVDESVGSDPTDIDYIAEYEYYTKEGL